MAPKIVLEEQEEFPTIPSDSIVHLKVDEVEVKEVAGRNGTWEKLEFKFKVLGFQVMGDGSPTSKFNSMIGGNLWGSVPFRLTDSPENKLRLWVEAILGMELGVGFELDTDYLRNREVRGITSTYNKRAIDPRTGQPFKAHQVDSLLPKGAGLPKAAMPAEREAAQQRQQPVSAGSIPSDDWGSEPPF